MAFSKVFLLKGPRRVLLQSWGLASDHTTLGASWLCGDDYSGELKVPYQE